MKLNGSRNLIGDSLVSTWQWQA